MHIYTHIYRYMQSEGKQQRSIEICQEGEAIRDKGARPGRVDSWVLGWDNSPPP